MFCPKCKSEYREGVYKCADCGVYLIDALPPKSEDDMRYVDMIEIFSTYNQGDIAFIKSVLDGEDIHYYFQDENTSKLIGVLHARLMVSVDEAARARELLQELGFL
ncbi:MAG: hypothetical protein A2W27_04580 [Deltaproteobacteria bacterium RBG_16_44_11]|nr:MAG: hypothetical protein A2W27_04580 [Deltaproteobacteria bacterium RBG_16_44_11]